MSRSELPIAPRRKPDVALSSRAIAAVVLAAGMIAGCKAHCPTGWVLQGELCHRVSADAGDMEPEDGSMPGDDGATGNASTSPGDAGGDSGASDSNRGGRGGASGKQADSDASGSGGAAQGGSSGATAGAAGPAKHTDGEAGTSGSSGKSSAPPRCGNGVKEAGETCDGDDCPKTCPAATGCMVMKLAGSTGACDVECVATEITVSVAGDDCCPVGANASTDSDCPAKCGDGIVDSNEKCEPSSTEKPCPTTCDDNGPCTKDTLSGTAAQCTAVCVNTLITKAVAGDMCCPAGENAESDSDCPTKCGDGVITGNETCDPASPSQHCPTSCDDGKACTTDILSGIAAKCTSQCANPPVTVAKDGDGCCPSGVAATKDNDCPSICGDGAITGNEECDPKAKGWSAWTCSADCTRATIYMPCGSDADCFGDYFGKRPTCNLTYAVCTIPCLGSNSCPAAPGGLTPVCATLGSNISGCLATGCNTYTDCGLGSSCVPLPLIGSQALVCLGCDTHAECPTGTMCRFMGSFGICR
ncbi:MAG: hypothetical protein RL701_1556 [Pseudomonadota bacterium]